ncbi:EAL domain-containing protein [Azospirillum sp.]|uniref:GGDEF/EAL domain-containing response regulator n=1 Tax=Azospirillum sp. TaxID=34012 RepID=UPI00260C3F3E|nr:EAL domain-containing protein [Azospirillum sp.]
MTIEPDNGPAGSGAAPTPLDALPPDEGAANDHLTIIEDGPADEAPEADARWLLLIVDDDPSVHSITRFALEDFHFEGRRLSFLSAYSGGEAKAILSDTPDIAVVLLDVVMETDTAGLEVAEHIRGRLDNRFVRIILRTGQPGQAPERDVIVNYDINDYKAKNELTAQKLFTAVLAALRAYNQIAALEMSRRGLEKILAASTTLYEQRSVAQFVDGVVLQIRSIIHDAQGALLCAVSGRHFTGDLDDVRVVAGIAPFAFRSGVPIRTTLPDAVCHEIAAVLEREESFFADDRCVIFFKTANHSASVVYLCGHRPLTVIDRKLLEVFCSKVAIGFDNAYLFEQITHEKTHDAVTGLWNRTAFVESLNARLADADHRTEMAICVLDCDRFRDVNESLGYEAGDRLLAMLARRIESALDDGGGEDGGGGDVAARLGADQFVVLKRGDRAALEMWAERLMAAVGASLILDGCEVIPSMAAGLTMVSDDRRAEDLIADADRAMRGAKWLGGGRYEFTVHRPPLSGEGRLMLVTQLIHAIRRNEFELFYQPIVSTADARLHGFEALIRWRHPHRGLLAPGAFIGVVEETGLILPLGSWVLDRAARQLAEWGASVPGAERLQVSVNVSARQFMNHDLTGEVAAVLDRTGLAPDRLKLEITESLIMNEPDTAERLLRALKALGVHLALDDFGTGYSSLSYLDRFPFDVLKIDRSFVKAMLHRRETMTVVQAICTLASNLGMELVGEGVEAQPEADALGALGCRWSQGYLFGRPMPAQEAAALIQRSAPLLLAPAD